MTSIPDHDVVTTMLQLGGNFIQLLARAYQAADTFNQQRIRHAFALEWKHYADLARLRLENENDK